MFYGFCMISIITLPGCCKDKITGTTFAFSWFISRSQYAGCRPDFQQGIPLLFAGREEILPLLLK